MKTYAGYRHKNRYPLKRRGALFALALLLLFCAVPAYPMQVQADTSGEDIIQMREYSSADIWSSKLWMQAISGKWTDRGAIVPDGVYTPTNFSFTGGTGKLKIVCPLVYVIGGQPYALLYFSSTHIPYVDAGGARYPLEDRRALIPVDPGREMEITALTTAMSTPHEVSYLIRADISRLVCDPVAAALIPGTSAAALFGESAGTEQTQDSPNGAQDARQEGQGVNSATDTLPEIAGLTVTGKMELHSADQFAVYNCQDGLRLIDVPQSARYLYVPEGVQVPDDIPSDIVILQGPFDSVYLAASSAMALIDAVGAIDRVTLSGTSEGSWLIDAPKKALADGKMVYAGKYSEPDFETMLQKGCDLAVESTMILHTPQVQEMIEGFGIPVFIDRSSYETQPLGRTEWVKLYGVLFEKEAEAEAFFTEQEKMISSLAQAEPTGATVAYFWITQQGLAVIRTSHDYVPGLISLAGGTYIFDGKINYPDTGSTMSVSMEQFYAVAADADYLVYNATIDDALENADDLLKKDALFADFGAFKEGNVWQVDKKAYQSTDQTAQLILDLHRMLTGETEGYTFLRHLQ